MHGQQAGAHFISDIYRRVNCKEFILNGGGGKKKTLKSPQPHIEPRLRHGQHWLTALPTLYTLNPFKTGTAFILAYCISLYVCADGPFMHIHTSKENIPDNLIHSGSSCNVGAAQQVVLWCQSLVSKINVLISSELSCMRKKKIQYNLENTLLSNKSLTGPPPQTGSAHSCVFAICRPCADVLQKCWRRAEGI